MVTFIKNFLMSKIFLVFFIPCILLFLACYSRIVNTHLEDDLLWMLPAVSQLLENQSMGGILKAFHSNELSLFDGFYYVGMLSLFGLKLKSYVLVMFVVHLLNTLLLFLLLQRRFKFSQLTCVAASSIYLTFYGHFHVYLWSMAMHHLFIIFCFLLLLNLYLKINELFDEGKSYNNFYCLTLVISVIASLTRLSVIIAPLMILTHILFTNEDAKAALRKFRLWFPVLFILPAYQLFTIALGGGYGNILDKLLEPFAAFLQECSLIGKSLIIFTAYAFFLGVLAFCLAMFVQRRTKNLFIPLIKKISCAVILAPHYFLLCLYLWLNSIPSAIQADPVSRWQPMNYPENAYIFVLLLCVSVFIMICFIRFMRERSNGLIIFLVWYVILTPFLGLTGPSVYSRYLIYISPIFGVVLCLFLIEILPSRFPVFKRHWYRWSIGVLIYAFILMNVAAIHIRSTRTMLADYHWSYDYVKISRLIVQDLSRHRDVPREQLSLCIEGIEQIPFAGDGKEGFLKNLDLERYDSFRQTFLSVYDRGDVQLKMNKKCLPADQAYYVNDRTVFGKDEKSIEPFYLFFDQGLSAFYERNYSLAEEFLNQAIQEKPFLINFMLNGKIIKNFSSRFRFQGIPEAVRKLYLDDYYCGDRKMNYIDTMIYHETQDYGKAMLLASYLKYRENESEESKRLLEEVFLWMGLEDALSNINDLILDEDFKGFVKSYPLRKLPSYVMPRMESYKDCDILACPDDYFVFKDKKKKELDITELKKNFDQGIRASSKYEIRRSIDQLPNFACNESLDFGTKKEDGLYKGFKVTKSGDIYRGFLEAKNSPPDSTMFQSRSPLEIKIIIDEYYRL